MSHVLPCALCRDPHLLQPEHFRNSSKATDSCYVLYLRKGSFRQCPDLNGPKGVYVFLLWLYLVENQWHFFCFSDTEQVFFFRTCEFSHPKIRTTRVIFGLCQNRWYKETVKEASSCLTPLILTDTPINRNVNDTAAHPACGPSHFTRFAWKKKIVKGDIELKHIFGEDPLGDRCVHCVIKLWAMLQDERRFLWTVDVSTLLAHRPSAQ